MSSVCLEAAIRLAGSQAANQGFEVATKALGLLPTRAGRVLRAPSRVGAGGDMETPPSVPLLDSAPRIPLRTGSDGSLSFSLVSLNHERHRFH